LVSAEKYAMTSWGGNINWQKGRVTKNMVRALLADIYLWLGEYDKCIAACGRIESNILAENEIISPDLQTGAELRLISNKTYILNSFARIFINGNSEESIFELQFRTNEKSNNKLQSLYYGDDSRFGNLAAAPFDTYDDGLLFPENDVRGQTSFTPVSKTGTTSQGFSKIVKYFALITILNEDAWSMSQRNVDTDTPNWIFYRVADIYLMKAEALVERNSAGDLDLALKLVNLTYMRSNPAASPLLQENYSSQELMRKLVFDERQREFLFEGKRWFDIVRMAHREDREAGKPDSHLDVLTYVTRKYTYNGDVIRSKFIHTDAFYLPVHSDELVNNTALKQNPYYEINMDKK
jgi:hypothetical protein